jgi:hypothetical protein
MDVMWGVFKRTPGWERVIDKWVHISIMGGDPEDDIPRYSTTGSVVKVLRRLEELCETITARKNFCTVHVGFKIYDPPHLHVGDGRWTCWVRLGGYGFHCGQDVQENSTMEMAVCQAAIYYAEGKKECLKQHPALSLYL